MQGHIHKRVHTCTDGQQTLVGTLYRCRSWANGRRRQQWHGGFCTRREAEVACARLVNDVHNRRYVMPNRLTLEGWVRGSWLR